LVGKECWDKSSLKVLIAFLRKKTSQGVRQSQIAKSIGKSSTYINWLVLDKRKNKYIDKQVIEKIADFFGLTVEQLLAEGKKIHYRNKTVSQKDNNQIVIHLHIHLCGRGINHVVSA